MKTLIKSLALALTLGFVTSFATFANTNPGGRQTVVASFKSAIYTTVSGKLSIALDKEIGGVVDVQLKNKDGKILYAQHLSKKERQYRRLLNVSELPDGDYQVEITNSVETTTHKMTLSTQQPVMPSRLVVIN
ncbi:hypothetical protein [Spirosoma endophyticum]|uniref:Por secretion system C-terminal sorting domain-containing protein n=1 Tax=Spirosoma endophyticum TaxID=662367 RepID=A0A1I1Q3P3_9BACT|nr:hypothetical protein [Spirosoma endophyticum]SFD16776.1 hypothetical protein SAMN05216167_103593 [Spirosoma endophyticum]